ncbi:hypothetical protein NSQ82_04595 [Caldifermentibacillus hisashii]|uniref:hypothetical protein n=1 Tax=Caldifermentibacillus hisashii TaxID=996558 RepID=UPI0031B69B70
MIIHGCQLASRSKELMQWKKQLEPLHMLGILMLPASFMLNWSLALRHMPTYNQLMIEAILNDPSLLV